MSSRAFRRVQRSRPVDAKDSEDETERPDRSNVFATLPEEQEAGGLVLDIQVPGTAGPDQPSPSQVDPDNLDALLSELRITGAGKAKGPEHKKPGRLMVDPRRFDYRAELERVFGQRSRPRRNSARPSAKLLVPMNPFWSKLGGLDLSMRRTEQPGHFHLHHGDEYAQVQRMFLAACSSHDPQQILWLLEQYPMHVDSCLSYSDMMEFQGQFESSSELVERAIYALNKATHPRFQIGIDTLEYQIRENRCYHLALFRHIEMVGRRGAWRSGFELCKYLLSLDSAQDPLGVAYSIDLFALQAKEYSFFAETAFYSVLASRHCVFPPNFYYSNALATPGDSSALLLVEAISRYPRVIVLLAEAKSIRIDPLILGRPLFQVPASGAVDLMQRLYVERCGFMWKTEQAAGLLSQALSLVDPDSAPPEQCIPDEACIPLYRHLHLLHLPGIRWSLPSSMQGQSIYSYDPLPLEIWGNHGTH